MRQERRNPTQLETQFKVEGKVEESILGAVQRSQTMDPCIKTSHALFDCSVAMTFREGVL